MTDQIFMAAIRGFMPDTVTIRTRGGVNVYAEGVYGGTGTVYPCRVEAVTDTDTDTDLVQEIRWRVFIATSDDLGDDPAAIQADLTGLGRRPVVRLDRQTSATGTIGWILSIGETGTGG